MLPSTDPVNTQGRPFETHKAVPLQEDPASAGQLQIPGVKGEAVGALQRSWASPAVTCPAQDRPLSILEVARALGPRSSVSSYLPITVTRLPGTQTSRAHTHRP